MPLAWALDGNWLRSIPDYVVLEGLAAVMVNGQDKLNQYVSMYLQHPGSVICVLCVLHNIRWRTRASRGSPLHYVPGCHATSLKGRVPKYLLSWNGASLRDDWC
jgi:hypothetical protein